MIPNTAVNPFTYGYDPDIYISMELDPVLSHYYQSQIRILWWMVELGRIDINTDFFMLALHLVLPREGHSEPALKCFSYLWGKNNSRLDLYPTYPEIDHANFQKYKCVDLYGNFKEAIPSNILEKRGKDVNLRMYVDRDHAVYKSMQISSMGLLIYMNMNSIQWLSKKQATIETSFFGVEFV